MNGVILNPGEASVCGGGGGLGLEGWVLRFGCGIVSYILLIE